MVGHRFGGQWNLRTEENGEHKGARARARPIILINRLRFPTAKLDPELVNKERRRRQPEQLTVNVSTASMCATYQATSIGIHGY